MGKRVDFERLRTMEDVLRERMRIRYDIKQREHVLKNDMERVGEVFTPDYWMAILSQKTAELVEQLTANVASRIRGIASGWGILDSLLSRLGNRFGKPEQQAKEYFVEEDFYYIPDDDDEDFFENERTC